jgi:threonine dehydrogenase-like Zn-dependent dehydrogenase
MPKRVIVIGAGAAGSMAAIFAATSGAETVLIERTRDGGRKILISGGGRCNILPSRVDESRFVTDSSPNVLKKMVRAWPLAEQRAFFETTLGIPLVEETESLKLFPASHRARDVRDGLLSYARRQGVQLLMETRVTAIAPEEGDGLVAHVRGRDVAKGVPSEISLNQSEIAEALAEPVARIVHIVRVALEQTQPEIAADIIDEGITMTGGGSLLRGIEVVLADETGLPVRVADDPMSCVAMGAGRTLEDADYRGALHPV